mgnify:FL=1
MVKLPFGIEINNLIDDLRIVGWEASDIILHFSNKIKDPNYKKDIIKFKKDNNPVTLADLKVSELIIQRINEKYSNVNWNILSEENINIESNCLKNSQWLWVLDPLDGTKDFIQGTGNYAMHLALNYKNKPFLGIVLIPSKNELWISNGQKIWCEDRNGEKTKKNISKNKKLQDMILVISKNHSNELLNLLINRIKFKKIIVMGSIGCKIASIVRGESDLYICLSLPGKTSPKDWDFAAPEAILKAAGGAITNLDNEELIYGKSNFEQGGIIIASNNINIHKMICLEIKEIIKKEDLYPL